jgi:diguanylate cyclase (GGDEF)-like protein/putative nucleotidyltransferase with HDIG domain
MKFVAKVYLGLVIAAGVGVTVLALSRSHEFHVTATAAAVAAVAIASLLKVPLPGVTGTLSVGFIFKLVTLPYLNEVEVLAVAATGVFVQAYWKPEFKPRPPQIAFNLANVSVAIYCAHSAFEVLSRWSPDVPTVALISAAAVYFAINTGVVSAIIALTERKAIIDLWRECYFWSFPYYLVGGGIASMFVLCLRHAGLSTALFIAPIVYLIYRSFRLYTGRLETQKEHAEDLADLHLRTIEALAMAIEAKDQTTHDHVQRVRVYAEEIGKDLRLDEDYLMALRAAALLHDIGKLAVPEHIICKPGKLTHEEFEKVKIHPVVGAEILQRVQFPYPVVPIVRSHHEKWDGSGYPDGLSGEDIPIGARILAVADCLDALASDRQYRRALPLEEALAAVVAESGKSFDPAVVKILASRHIELERLAWQNDGGHDALETEISVERGDAPAAGFERSKGSNDSSGAWSSIALAKREAQVFYELTREVGRCLSLEETLGVLEEGLKKLVPFDTIAVYLHEQATLTPARVSGVDHVMFSSLKIPVGEGLSGWVAENQKPIVNGNPAVESGYLGSTRAFSTLRSALAVPLAGSAGVLGVLALYSRGSDAYTDEQLRVVNAVSSLVSPAIENAVKYREIRECANEDYLTGLPNARAMFERLDKELARAKRQRSPLALAMCDLDGFKAVNDTLGHIEGNRLLKEIANTLNSQCREYDLVARMGGDEFVLAMPGVGEEMMPERIRAIRRSIDALGESVSISVGVAIFPDDGADAESLLVEADTRMYFDKQQKKRQGRETTTRLPAAAVEV